MVIRQEKRGEERLQKRGAAFNGGEEEGRERGELGGERGRIMKRVQATYYWKLAMLNIG